MMGTIFAKYLKRIILLILFFAVAFGGLYGYSQYANSKEHVVHLGNDNDFYRFTYEISKSWQESSIDYRYGTQCDFEIENRTENVMDNWVVEIETKAPCLIDSSWNGHYTINDCTITMSTLDYNDTVEPGEIQPFGFILKGPEEDNIAGATIRYHVYRRLEDYPLFYVLILLAIIFLCSTIVGIAYAAKNEQLRRDHETAVRIINQSFITFANIIDAKDKYTKGHSQRVAYYARELAARMGFDEEKQNSIFYIGLLHDVGKIGVQDAILKKNARLTKDEFDEIKEHVSMGGDILKNFTTIEGIEDGARYHHERYDGTGYMTGLKGKEIPVIARIICVADAFDAMSSARCYREIPLTNERIIAEFTKYSGTQFDPEIVPIMIEMINEGVAPIELSDDELEKEFSIIKKVELKK